MIRRLPDGLGYKRGRPTFICPKSARAYLFPQSVRMHELFAAGPLVLTPFVRNQLPAPPLQLTTASPTVQATGASVREHQDSSKGGAVETGCSNLYGVIH